MPAALVPAVAYYRKSKATQEASIDKQRREVEAFATANGYRVVREYVDEGISGWKAKERREFIRLIEDADEGDFSAVLVYDQDRFSRFGMRKFFRYLDELADAGVVVVSVNQGVLNTDDDDIGSTLKAGVDQHAKREYARSIAIHAAPQLAKLKRSGVWTSNPPFGYDKGQDGHLVPNDSAGIVRDIFHWRREGAGLGEIAKRLNDMGIATPRAGTWCQQKVRHVLKRKAYIGVVVIGEHSRAQFRRCTEGIEEIADAHPAIVDMDAWDAVQAMWWTKGKKTRYAETAPLSGLLVCGRCGALMYPTQQRRWKYYKCSTNMRRQGCGHCALPQEATLDMLGAAIRRFCTDEREALEAAVERTLRRRVAEPAKHANTAIAKQVSSLTRQIDRAAERLLAVDDSLVPTVTAKLNELQGRRDRLQRELDASDEPPTPRQLNMREVLDSLWTIGDRMKLADPAKLRPFLVRLIEQVRLDFEPGAVTARGQKMEFAGGEMRLCQGELIAISGNAQPRGRSCC